MAHTTVRITEEARDLLGSIAEEEGASMQAVLSKALEAYRRERFIAEVNAGYSKLREESSAWHTMEADRSILDAAIGDGLPEGEVWTEDGRAIQPKPNKANKDKKMKSRRRR
jgi:hypothetical protein